MSQHLEPLCRLADEDETAYGWRLLKFWYRHYHGGHALPPWMDGPTTSQKLAMVAALKQVVPAGELLEILGVGDRLRQSHRCAN